MIDGFKCSCIGLLADKWNNNPLLDFGLSVSESTGEILSQRKEARAEALRFVLSPTVGGSFGCSIAGSLHKHAKETAINWDDFTLTELSETLNGLADNYGLDLEKSIIHTLEIGVNICLDYSPKRIFQSVICHKGKPFDHIDRKNRSLGISCEHTDYIIKLYNKAKQSQLPENEGYILRYELKLKRQRMIEPYNIRTLADLKNVENLTTLIALLLEKLAEIVFFDFSLSTKELTDMQRMNWERYSNPKYWESLNRRQYYNARQLYDALCVKYEALDYGKMIAEKVIKKWFELSEIKQETVGHFPQLFERIESAFGRTFSKLEYLLENVLFDHQKTKKENNQNFVEKSGRFCVSCGRDISHQKKGSRFCSEKEFGKEAKRCRNKDSNRRLGLKRKIDRAMKKELMLQITYTDFGGNEFTDTLGANELAISREWLDRVKSVTVLKPQPEKLESKEAINYLKSVQNER